MSFLAKKLQKIIKMCNFLVIFMVKTIFFICRIEAYVIHRSYKKNFGVNHISKDLCRRVSNQPVWLISTVDLSTRKV